MRVLSWNIHCLRGGASRVGAIADAIAGHAPDVVALQEVSVEKGFAEVLAGALAERGLAGCAIGRPPEGARKRYGNVVASRWEVHSPDVGPVVDGESRHWRHLVFSAREYPRRKWQDAVARVLDGDTALGVRRLPPEDGSYQRASHVTRGRRGRLFDHVLVSGGVQSPGVTYDASVLGGPGHDRLSDHAIVVADLTIR